MAVTLPPLPPPTVPLVDPKTGLVNRDWYLFLTALRAYIATL